MIRSMRRFARHAFTVLSAVSLLLCVAGCDSARHGEDATHHSALDDDAVTLRVITAPATQVAPPAKYRVTGELSDADLSDLERLVARLTDQPILHIRVIRPNVVEVMTGVVHSPLAGGGQFFDFEMQNGRWVQTKTNEARLWKS